MTDIRNDMPAIMTLLREWASGYKPSTAAVEFLIHTGQVPRAISCGLVKLETDETTGRRNAYIDRFNDDWKYEIGVYSSGERAILLLAGSLHHGELDDCLWSLDRANRKAFTDAIIEAGKR